MEVLVWKQPKFVLGFPLVLRAREISEPPGESQVLNSAGASGWGCWNQSYLSIGAKTQQETLETSILVGSSQGFL